MSSAGSLAYCFDSLRNVQRQLLAEGKREGGDAKDKKLAQTLGQIAKQLAGVIGQKSDHEGDEAITLTDADDAYLPGLLGEDFGKMADLDNDETLTLTGDAFTDAIIKAVAKAREPSPGAMMTKAGDQIKESRKAMKAARTAIEECHKLHKAAYLAKLAKARKSSKDDDEDDSGEFDHAGAMEKLAKAFTEIEKARTFTKAAEGQLTKLAGRSGQRGQEAGDPEGDHYVVPPGVKDLTPEDMATAGPAAGQRGSTPPQYPLDGSVFPGKAAAGGPLAKYAKTGVPVEVAQLMLEKAAAESQLAILRSLPASAAGRQGRPANFDIAKAFGGSASGAPNTAELNKALFDGVDVGAIGSQDESSHRAAASKVLGNLIMSGKFGNSVFDPGFRGTAGGKN